MQNSEPTTAETVVVKALTHIYPRSGENQPVGAVFELPAGELDHLRRTGQVIEARPDQVAAYRDAHPEPGKEPLATDGDGSPGKKPKTTRKGPRQRRTTKRARKQ